MRLDSYFVSPSTDLINLSNQRQHFCTTIQELHINGEYEQAIAVAQSYAGSFSAFFNRRSSRQLKTRQPLIFSWKPLFSEREDGCAESSTCVWFELAMTHALTAQLYYYHAVERLGEYADSESSLKFAAFYFANAAHEALQAQHVVQQRWHTSILTQDPVIRDTEATQLWTQLCLASAQHCYVIRVSSAHSNKQLMLSKLCMGEASLYKQILQLMKDMNMCSKLRELHNQVGSLYIAAVSRAYEIKLNSIETTSENICKKEAAWTQLISDIETLLPDLPHELADKEYRKAFLERKHARFISDSAAASVKRVGRELLPEMKIHVKPLPPQQT